MIIVKLQGGLGNQMFQYAAAKSLVTGNASVLLDYSFLSAHTESKVGFTARSFELGIFRHLKAKTASKWHLDYSKGTFLYNKILRNLLGHTPVIIQQRGMEYIDISPYKFSGCYLDGYFQSEKHFVAIQDKIKNDFTFPELDKFNDQLKHRILSLENAVSLHIRRGDYLKSKQAENTHGIVPIAYYQMAIKDLRMKYPLAELFVFSDDISWAKTNLLGSGLKLNFIDGNCGRDSWKDMALMSCCKHHIIANSSFSWWGAWLSESNGQTYAPYKWFNPDFVEFKIEDFVPQNWTVLVYD